MESIIERRKGVTIIAPEGELDTHNSNDLKQILTVEMQGGAAKILVDMAKVGYMDSAALGALVSGLKQAKGLNVQFKLANIRGPVAKIFQLTRLNKFFDIYSSIDEAIASFN